MRHSTFVFLALVALGATGCVPKKIPGTDLDDTTETRAIIEVMQKYRSAVETKNTAALVQLADPTFKDDGGSATPEDDLDYASLETKLGERMSKVKDVKLDLTVKRIEFSDESDVARVTYTYQMSFRMPDYTSRLQSENDIKQMLMKRSGEQAWKIISGI